MSASHLKKALPDIKQPDLTERAGIAQAWWKGLQARMPGDRAALARLRRCASVFEAALEPATIDLYRRLGYTRPDRYLPRVAALASVLAHVRPDDRGEHSREKLARALGAPQGGKPEDALLKPLRFKRLMAVQSPDDLLAAFRRVVALLKGQANVRDLANLILVWEDEAPGQRLRLRFAFDYYDAGNFAPGAKNEQGEGEI